ncbi:MAG: hypothetical protein WC002_06925 [Candidatus Muiribacteriota bacterium]
MKKIIIFIQDETERNKLKNELTKNNKLIIAADAENFDDFNAVIKEYDFDTIIASHECTGFPKFNEYINSLNNSKEIFLISTEKIDYFEKKSIHIKYFSDINQIKNFLSSNSQ